MATRASFQNLANKLINSVFADFRDIAVFELMAPPPTYNDQVPVVIETIATAAIRLEYDKTQFDGQSVQQGDYQIVLEQQPITFDVRADNVNLTFNGKAVSILGANEDAARAALILQVRDK